MKFENYVEILYVISTRDVDLQTRASFFRHSSVFISRAFSLQRKTSDLTVGVASILVKWF